MSDRPLPCNLDAERLALGTAMNGSDQFDVLAGAIHADDFSLEKHRRIWRRMVDLNGRGEAIDHVTLTNELRRHGELESCDGIGYLVSLDDGLPQIYNLESYARIIVEKAVLRRTIHAAQALMIRCMEARDDSQDILAQAESVLAKLSADGNAAGQWMRPGEIMRGFPGGINLFMAPPRGGVGLATPWPRLTEKLCGLHRGDLSLVAGRPSSGKSVIALALGHHAALQGEGVAVISLEMTKASLVRRLISAVGGVDAQRLRTGCLDSEERKRAAEAGAQISDLPLWIDDTRARSVPAVTSALRKLAARHPVRLVIIDHLQLMRGAGRFEGRHQELSEISHSLKHLAGSMDVTVLLLSQLNRECEKTGRRPQLSDLKETGSLEEDADVVLFIHRPEQFNRQDPSLRGKAEFIVGKQRNGPTGKVNMLFQPHFQRFVEPAGNEQMEFSE